MQKGRHWVLVVSNTPNIRHVTQITVLGLVAGQCGPSRHIDVPQLHTLTHSVIQIINESLPIFLDSAVSFTIAYP